MTIKLKNDAETTLTASATDTELTLAVVDTSSMPALGAGQEFTLTITDGSNHERVTVVGVAPTELTLSARGVESTVKRSWPIDTPCKLTLTAGTLLTSMQDGFELDAGFADVAYKQGEAWGAVTAGLNPSTTSNEEPVPVDSSLTSFEINTTVGGVGFIQVMRQVSGSTYEAVDSIEITAAVGINTYSVSGATLPRAMSILAGDIIALRLPSSGAMKLGYVEAPTSSEIFWSFVGDTGVGSQSTFAKQTIYSIALSYEYTIQEAVAGAAYDPKSFQLSYDNRDAIVLETQRNLNLTPRVQDLTAYVIGDSTIAAFAGGTAIFDLLNTIRPNGDISVPGDNISQQLGHWNALTITPSLVGYVVIEIGLNDLDPAEASAVALARLQNLVDTVRSDITSDRVIILAQMSPCRERLIDVYGEAQGEVSYQKWLAMNDAIIGNGGDAITGVDYTASSHVAKMNDGLGNLLPSMDTGDHIHPNDTGRAEIRDSWVDVLRRLAGFIV